MSLGDLPPTGPLTLSEIAVALGVPAATPQNPVYHALSLRLAAHNQGYTINGVPFPLVGAQSDFRIASMGAGTPSAGPVFQAFISTVDFGAIGDWPPTRLYYTGDSNGAYLDVSIIRWPDLVDVPDEAEVDALFSSTHGSPTTATIGGVLKNITLIKLEWTPYNAGGFLQTVWAPSIPSTPLFGQRSSTFWTLQNLATHTLNIHYSIA